MIFSTTLEIKDTLAIGRKLPESVGSSPSRLMTGIRIDIFWAGGKTPSTMDRLQIHSFIHYGDLYSAPSRLLLRSAPDPCTAKKKSFETRVECVRKNPGKQS